MPEEIIVHKHPEDIYKQDAHKLILDSAEEWKSNWHIQAFCEDCIFKQIDIDPKLQTGCYLGKLDDFIRAGATVDFVQETLSFKINRHCKWFRDKDWALANQDKDKYELVRDATNIRWSAILELSDPSKIERALDNIIYQGRTTPYIKPQSIVIITKCDVSSILMKLKGMNLENIPWILESLVEDETTDRSIQRMVKHKSLKSSQYYVWFVDDNLVHQDFIEHINDIVNKEMVQLLAIFPKDGNHGLVVNKSLHSWFYMQSKEDTIVSHLKKILDNDIGTGYTRTWAQILQKT
jgi:hypothetical protein